MKYLILIFILSYGACCYGQLDSVLNTIDISIIELDTAQHWSWRLEGNKSIKVTEEQIQRIDSIIDICIKENNNNGVQTNTAGMYIGIKDFKKQIVPSINKNEELIIWANCICEDFIDPEPQEIEHEKKRRNKPKEKVNKHIPMTVKYFDSWKENIISVNDGGIGGCFFNVKINLNTKSYSNLYINGM